MKHMPLCLCLSWLGLFSLEQSTASSEVIYHHEFNGDAEQSVLGQAPEVRPGQEVFVSNDTARWTEQVRADGQVSASGGSPSFYLPFHVRGPEKYVLGIDVEMNPTASGEDWYGVAFIRGPLPEADKSLAAGYSALFLLRGNGDAQFLTWGTDPSGPGTAELEATSGRLEIIMDNTREISSLCTLEFRFNGKTVYQTIYAGFEFNPDMFDPVTHIGFGKHTADSPLIPGKFGNLKLEVTR